MVSWVVLEPVGGEVRGWSRLVGVLVGGCWGSREEASASARLSGSVVPSCTTDTFGLFDAVPHILQSVELVCY